MNPQIDRLKSLFPEPLHGRLFLVGGMVRDILMGIPCQDVDLAASIPPHELIALGFRLVESKSTPNIYFRFDRHLGKLEITALPSTEALVEDLERRDFTMNAMAMTLDGELYDPLGGRKDLEERVLRTCSQLSLANDPARIFRALRFECDGFRLDREAQETITGNDWSEALARIPVERFSQEMLKSLEKKEPGRFFERMLQLGVGRGILPELFSMPQVPAGPVEHHPEGDLFTHSLQVLDRVAKATEDSCARFCALFHDLGKLDTPPELYPKHHGHEEAGAQAALPFCRRLRLPAVLMKALQGTCRLHLKANRWHELRDSTKLKLAGDALKAGIAPFLPVIVAADCGGVMPGWEQALRVAALNVEQLGFEKGFFEIAQIAPEKRAQLIFQRKVQVFRESCQEAVGLQQ